MKWWQKSVVYQIYPRSFMDSNGDGIGDLNGITEKLPYVAELGADVIWLSPIFASPNDDNGYDISDYRAIMTEFGTMADFDRLLARAHELGLKIVLDLVANHSSDEHAWFIESKRSAKGPYADFYFWHEGYRDAQGRVIGPPNRWGSMFGGSVWTFAPSRGAYYLHSFSPKQPDLNWQNPAVREAVYDFMRFWCDKGIDGFRMDAINFIGKDDDIALEAPDPSREGFYEKLPYWNHPRAIEYLREMNREVLSRYDLMTVGETGGVSPAHASRYAPADGSVLSMIFQFEHVDMDRPPYGSDAWRIEAPFDLPRFKEILSRWQTELRGKAWNSLYLCNHDLPRPVSRWGCDEAPWREKSAKMLAHCLHFMQGTPYIYQGEELGMTNMPFRSKADFRDIEALNRLRDIPARGEAPEEEVFRHLCRFSRDNARTPMQWNAGKNAGFSEADETWIAVNPNHVTINAEEQLSREDSVFRYYQALIRLRHREPLLTDGTYELLDPDSFHNFCYLREDGEGVLYVACAFSREPQTVPVPARLQGLPGEVWLTNDETLRDLRALPAGLTLPGYAAVAFYIRKNRK